MAEVDEGLLLDAMAAAPHDLGARLVYADYLQSRGDVRGELIAVQHARDERPGDLALASREREVAAAVAHDLLGPRPGIELAWTHGFVDSVTLTGTVSGGAILACATPAFRMVRCIRTANPYHSSRTSLDLGESVRRLELGSPTASMVSAMDVEPMLRAYPRTSELSLVTPQELSYLNGVALTSLAVRIRWRRLADELLAGTWPLESLHVHLDEDTDISLAALAPLLEGKIFPQLRDFALADASFTDDLLVALASSPLLKRLETLGISPSKVSFRGVEAIVAQAAAFAHVRFVLPSTEPESSAALAKLLDRLGRPAAAIEHYRRRVREAPSDVSAGLAFGDALLELGRAEEALKAFEPLAALGLRAPGEAWFGSHLALLQLGRRTEAVEALERAVAIDFRNAAWWRSLALLLDEQGRTADAASARERAVQASRSMSW